MACPKPPAVLLGAAWVVAFVARGVLAMPEQIRLSITRRPDEMVVTWVTPYWAGTSMVAYGKAASTLSDRRWTQDNDEYDFKGGYGAEHYARSVRLRYLEPNTQYFYRVGNDKQGWSQVFWFKTREADINATTTFAVVADQDMNEQSKKVLSQMITDGSKYEYNFAIIGGDIAYANGDQWKWNAYGNWMQNFSAYYPTMYAVGDRDVEDGGTEAYSNRYRWGVTEDSQRWGWYYNWYSYIHGPVYVIVLSSEHFSDQQVRQQVVFLETELIKADDPSSRAIHPWIVVIVHRPSYNNPPGSRPGQEGLKSSLKDGFLPLYAKYKVNAVICGHCHNYERTFPLKGNEIVDRNRGWESSPYIAPVYFYGSGKPYSQGTVHLTVGTGGRPVEDVGERPGVHEKPCIVKQTLGNVFLGGQSWIEREKDCSNGCFSKDNTAYINTDIGFGVIEANRDKLHFKFISAEFPGELVDEMIMCTMPDCKPAPMVFIDGGGYGIAEEVQDEPAEDANKPQNHTEAEQKVPGTGASDAQQTIPTQEDSATPPETPAQAKSPSQDNPPPKQSWQEDTTGSKDAASSPRPANTTQPEKQPPQSPADLDKGTPKPAEGSSVMKPSGPGPSAKDTSREIGEVQPVRLDEPLQQRVKLSIWPDLRTKPKDKYELDEDEEPPEDIPQPGTLFLPVYVPSQQRYAPMPVGMDLDEFLKQYRSSDNIAGGAPGGISKPVVGSDPAGTAVPGWDDPAKDTTPSAEDIASALEEGAPSAPRNTALVIAASAAACGLVLLISVSLVAWRVMRKPNNGQNKSVAGGKSPPIYDPSAGPGDLEVHVAGVIQGGVMSRTPGGRA